MTMEVIWYHVAKANKRVQNGQNLSQDDIAGILGTGDDHLEKSWADFFDKMKHSNDFFYMKHERQAEKSDIKATNIKESS